MRIRKHVGALLLSFMLLSVSICHGQADFDEEDRATMVFDIDVAKLIKNDLLEEFGPEMFDGMSREFGVDLAKVTRFYGAFKWCDDIMDLARGPQAGEEFPVDFIWRIDYTDPSAGGEMYEEFSRMDKKIIDGKEYYSPGDEAANVFFHFADDHMVAATGNYLFKGDMDFLTPRLKSALASVPERHAVRGAVDIIGSKDFLDSMFEADRDELWGMLPPAELMSFIQNYRHIDQIGLAFDPGQTTLLKVVTQSADEEAAKKFNDQVTQLLNMAKFGYQMAKSEIGIEDEEALAAMQKVVDQLGTQVQGDTVRLQIDQPDGFTEMVAALVAQARQQAMEVQKLNTFRQAGLAILNYESAYTKFPFNHTDERVSDKISWRAKVLPFIEQQRLYEKMDLSKAFDDEANADFIEKMPLIYGEDGKTTSICWIKSGVERFADITDGSSNTIMLMEIPDGKPWLENDPPTILEVIKMFKEMDEGESVVVTMYDCSTRRIDSSIDHNTLKALLTPAGGEIVNFDW